jgi:hypothetical protein
MSSVLVSLVLGDYPHPKPDDCRRIYFTISAHDHHVISGRYRDIAHHFSVKGFNFVSVLQQVAALLAHDPAGLESFISMTSGGGHASDAAWAKATRIARELDRVLDGAAPVREAVMRAASELRLSTRQVYNYLARYREERRVSALLPRRSGTRKPRINPAVENIIAVTLREMWLRPEQPDLAPMGLSQQRYVTHHRNFCVDLHSCAFR